MLLPRQRFKLARGTKDKEHAMSHKLNTAIAVIGIDIGKNSFHVVGHDERGAIVLRQKWSRGQVEARFSNMPPCLVGMEACVGAHQVVLIKPKSSNQGPDTLMQDRSPPARLNPLATHGRTIHLGHTLPSRSVPGPTFVRC